MDDLFSYIKSLISKDMPLVTNLANVSAILNKMSNINWCGFYLVKNNDLYLGPFQGDVACTKILYGKGVCGEAFRRKETLIVSDVNNFPGHIACSPLSKSEIVTPIFNKNGDIVGVIDIDSPIKDRFSIDDKIFLENIATLLKDLFNE